MANKNNKDEEDKASAGPSYQSGKSPKKAMEVTSDTKNDFKLKRELLGAPSRDAISHGRRRSVEKNSMASETLVSHALREVVSDHIIAGPRGALLTVKPSTSKSSLEGPTSPTPSSHTIEFAYLRRTTMEGVDVPVDFDDAIAETGHGRFQYELMALCGFIYSCCSLSTTTLSFVLPAAQNDFNLDSLDKGILNTAPIWGMVAGAYVWGNFADSKGRRFVLMYSLLIDAFAAILSSLCQIYTLFFICRIFNGFGIIGATSMVFAYLGEFIDHHRRDRYLSRLELFWTFGLISLPVIGFAILPRDWELGSHKTFMYNSWRMFVLACGLPSLVAAILISRMPESPRFLLLQKKHDKTRQVLVRMFVTNCKMAPEHYPVKVLNMDAVGEAYYFHKVHGASYWTKIKKFCRGLYKQHKDLLRGRSLFYILITCFIDFGLMFVYFTVTLWMPDLLHRHDEYGETHNNSQVTICDIGRQEVKHEADKVDSSTFLHSFIICMSCLPTNIMLLCIISYISKKSLLVAFLLITAIPTASLHYVNAPFQLTTMLCLFEAFATLVETVLFCVIVEIFPFNTRGTALALTVTLGRFGAGVGNILFGLLIDTHCHIVFLGMSGVLVASGLSALLLPKMVKGHGGG